MSKKHKSPPLSAPDRGREGKGRKQREILLCRKRLRQWIGLSGRRRDAKSLKWTTAWRQEERVKPSSHDTECHVRAQGSDAGMLRRSRTVRGSQSPGKSQGGAGHRRCTLKPVGNSARPSGPCHCFVLLELFFCRL